MIPLSHKITVCLRDARKPMKKAASRLSIWEEGRLKSYKIAHCPTSFDRSTDNVLIKKGTPLPNYHILYHNIYFFARNWTPYMGDILLQFSHLMVATTSVFLLYGISISLPLCLIHKKFSLYTPSCFPHDSQNRTRSFIIFFMLLSFPSRTRITEQHNSL